MPTPDKADNRSNAIIQTLRRRILVNEMKEYSFLGVYVDEDVINKNGAVLIPKGTDMSSLTRSVPSMEESLRSSQISTISIVIQEQLNVSELEEMITSSEVNLFKIDSKLARDTVEQVSDVYSRIAHGECEKEDIVNLMDQGKTLAKVVAEAPEIMFCLGHVRGSDEYTYVHSLNVALMGGFIANKLFPDKEQITQLLSMGGILHDLGKAKVPNAILNKPGPLTDDEFEIMKKHTIYGEALAKEFGVNDPVILSMIRGHHERYNGGGYPDILSKDKISLAARITAVTDVFDALTARRVYKEPMECRHAVLMMIEKMSMHFDPEILRTLIVSIGLYPPGATVELSDGRLGVVVGTSGSDLIRPNVMITFNQYGQKAEQPQVIDLSKNEESLFIKRMVHDIGKIAF